MAADERHLPRARVACAPSYGLFIADPMCGLSGLCVRPGAVPLNSRSLQQAHGTVRRPEKECLATVRQKPGAYRAIFSATLTSLPVVVAPDTGRPRGTLSQSRRTTDARAVEAELHQLLAVADDDHAVNRRLSRAR